MILRGLFVIVPLDKVLLRKLQSESKEDEELSSNIVPTATVKVLNSRCVLSNDGMSGCALVLGNVFCDIQELHIVQDIRSVDGSLVRLRDN